MEATHRSRVAKDYKSKGAKHCVSMTAVLWMVLAILRTIAGNQTINSFTNSTETNIEGYLASQLVRGYKERGTGSRPVSNATQPIQVRLNLWLIQILEFDIKQQVISTLVWKEYEWRDIYLTWDPADFKGLKRIFLQPHQIWTPDIELYNTLDGKDVENHEDRMMVWYNGTVVWVPHLIYKSMCPVDVTDFPFDMQVCRMKFGSWIYSDSFLELSLLGPEGFTLDHYNPTGEWELLYTNVTQNSNSFYDDQYTTLTFEMTLKRNSGLWVRLILLPMVILSAITCVVFWIPPHRPDRTTISMSLFSSFFLLLLLIVQSAPPTSATRVVLCCTVNIVMVGLALMLSVISVNLYIGRGVCRTHMEGVCCNVFGGCCKKNQEIHERTEAQSMLKAPESPRRSPVNRAERKPELTRSQKLALTLDTIAFLLFLGNFVVIVCILHMVPPF